MFRNPSEYTKENIEEIMNIPLSIEIGKYNSEVITETIEGEIVNCTLAVNPPFLPASLKVITRNGEKILSIMEIKRFRNI
ncbi:hypothetical protein [Flavobacterium sp. PS2]|uniref:hypothetical protein n=1 Tax=Flavobacterium sp. PS2 TaxID=3384157 RepID=UPI00390CAEDC